MNRRQALGYRGQRTGPWARTKWTNLNSFDPGDCEMQRLRDRYRREIESDHRLCIRQDELHPAFVMPVSKQDVLAELRRVPAAYRAGLKAVLLLGGSKAQLRAFRSLFAYGRYYEGVIYLHPHPKTYLSQRYKVLPKPSDLLEYERAGARIVRSGDEWEISFDRASLRTFYLRDVLIHELGHHVDRDSLTSRPDKKVEGFANWFASEYGYKLRRQAAGRRYVDSTSSLG